MANRRRFAQCFWALTPVALRAPSVSAQKHEPTRERTFPSYHHEESKKNLDGCRSLFHTEKVLRRFAPN